jgi:hypothetical protein
LNRLEVRVEVLLKGPFPEIVEEERKNEQIDAGGGTAR